MSIEAINWALNRAPAFAEEDPRQRPHLAIVLIGLANHADPDGHNAFPSIDTLRRYTRLSESTVRRCLHRLAELGVIRPADPAIVAAYITRPDRRPNGYDLAMTTPPVDNAVDNRVDGVSHQPVPNVSDGVSYQADGVSHDADGVSHQARRGVTRGGHRGRYDTRTVQEPSRTRPARKPAPASRPRLPPPCGYCDARPGDPASARLVWLNRDRTRSEPCRRCHPNAIHAPGDLP